MRACSACHLYMHGAYVGTPRIATIPPKYSVTVMWRPHHPCGHFPPTHACHKYVLLTHQSLFLPCFAFATCQCIPLHPSELIPTLLSPSLPPVCLTAHVCIFGEISRPYMAGNHTLLAHLCLFLSCFVVR